MFHAVLSLHSIPLYCVVRNGILGRAEDRALDDMNSSGSECIRSTCDALLLSLVWASSRSLALRDDVPHPAIATFDTTAMYRSEQGTTLHTEHCAMSIPVLSCVLVSSCTPLCSTSTQWMASRRGLLLAAMVLTGDWISYLREVLYGTDTQPSGVMGGRGCPLEWIKGHLSLARGFGRPGCRVAKRKELCVFAVQCKE